MIVLYLLLFTNLYYCFSSGWCLVSFQMKLAEVVKSKTAFKAGQRPLGRQLDVTLQEFRVQRGVSWMQLCWQPHSLILEGRLDMVFWCPIFRIMCISILHRKTKTARIKSFVNANADRKHQQHDDSCGEQTSELCPDWFEDSDRIINKYATLFCLYGWCQHLCNHSGLTTDADVGALGAVVHILQ